MDADEQAIRSLVQTWMKRPPTRKDAFAVASKAMEGKVRVEGAAGFFTHLGS